MVKGPRLAAHHVRRARAISRVAGAFAVLVGTLALAGWVFDAALLKGLYAGITMKANAAIAFILVGTSLRLLHSEPRRWVAFAGQATALVAGAIGAATLFQHVTGWDLGIDQIFFVEEPGAAATASPGRMGPPASTCFALAGLALWLLHRRALFGVAQAASVAIGLIALFASTGYAYGVESLYGVARYTGIALHTALTLLVLSVGLLAATAERGVASVFVSAGAGSTLARRLLIFALVTPLVLGWARLRLEEAGHFDVRFGIAALVLAITVILAALIVLTAARLNRAEDLQLLAEDELRDRLQELEAVMEVLPIGVLIATDGSGTRIKGNRAAREFLRMPEPLGNLSLSGGDEAPRHFRVLRDGVEVPANELPVQRAAREGVATRDTEFDVVFEDGVVKRELITALPLLGQDGRPRGAVASVMDVTMRRAAEQEREELLARAQVAREQAETANRSKDEFLATISHELRTPLSAILGWAAMLREGVTMDERTKELALATIERNSISQARLIDDLLDVSRIVAGKLRLDLKPLDIGALVTTAVDVVRPAAEAKEIGISTAFDATGCIVRGDATRLQQVVWNLLTNAVKFTGRGGHVTVRLTVGERDATIVVRDEGEGIDAEFLPLIFDRFTQADGKKTRRHGGLGLGLSIARHLVEMHGGTIEAASAGPGQGATFTVRLPRHSPGGSDLVGDMPGKFAERPASAASA